MLDDALRALRAGQIILLYDFDDRERETDLAIRADAVQPSHIRQMRRDGGGLICTAISPESAKRLGLPFATDLLRACDCLEQPGDIPYDPKNRSAFSLWVNHRRTFTGITDRDRALTITELAGEVKRSLNGGGDRFMEKFRTPGHVAILRAADGLLDTRRGQTELSIALAELAGITPAVTICEMLDNENGFALSKEDACAYAARNGLVFIEGQEVLDRWNARSN
jgi:3,4-dihydroxy 2-butanone 4-phosphate synthase